MFVIGFFMRAATALRTALAGNELQDEATTALRDEADASILGD